MFIRQTYYILGQHSVLAVISTKALKVIKDPKAFELLADETRRRMIFLLRAREQTVAQIAHDMGLTPQAIYHHIRKLEKAGMVEVSREERVGHLIESYYRATAELFQCFHGEGKKGQKHAAEKVKEALEGLNEVGMKIPTDDETVASIVKTVRKMEKLEEISFENKIADNDDIDCLAKEIMMRFAGLLKMTDKQFEDYLELHRQIRSTLK